MRGGLGDMMVAVVFVTLVAILLVGAFTSLGMTPDSKTEALIGELNSSYSNIRQNAEQIHQSLEKIDVGNLKTLFNPLGAPQMVLSFVSLIASVPSVFNNVVNGLLAYFGVPGWIGSFITTAVLIAVVIGAINWFRGGGKL